MKYNQTTPKTKGNMLDQHKRPVELVACQFQTPNEAYSRKADSGKNEVMAFPKLKIEWDWVSVFMFTLSLTRYM